MSSCSSCLTSPSHCPPSRLPASCRLLAGLALAAMLAAAPAMAQDAPFEGLSLGLNLAVHAESTEFSTGGNTVHGLGLTSPGSSLQAAYGWSAGDYAMFSVGMDYNVQDVSGGDFHVGGSGGYALKRRNAYSVYIEPGYKLSDHTLGYLKLGYEAAKLDASTPGGPANSDLEGASYGLGLRTLLDDHFFVQVEVRQMMYNNVNLSGHPASAKAAGTLGLVGIGYQFN